MAPGKQRTGASSAAATGEARPCGHQAYDGFTGKARGVDGSARASQAASGAGCFDAMAAFRLLHTSRDGRVCFFQDREGRITAVNAARLV